MRITDQDCLIVVDVQNDFTPGGALAAEEGDKIIPIINDLLPRFSCRVFSRDWHPPDHVSFSPNPEFRDRSWPPHSVQETEGAEFHPDLEVPPDALIVSKATRPEREEYSAFDVPIVDPETNADLGEWLRNHGVNRVFVTGIATDYCVRQTALDALAESFEVWLIEDAVRGVAPETTAKALEDLDRTGVGRVESGDIE